MDARRGFGLILALLLVLVGCSSTPSAASVPSAPPATAPGAASPTARVTQTSEGGQVTVVATWAGPRGGAVFDLTLDTHSVDLDALDLVDAILRNDKGEELTARPWLAPAGGHHRAGILSFDGDDASFFASARWVELVLSGIGDLPERTLRWETD